MKIRKIGDIPIVALSHSLHQGPMAWTLFLDDGESRDCALPACWVHSPQLETADRWQYGTGCDPTEHRVKVRRSDMGYQNLGTERRASSNPELGCPVLIFCTPIPSLSSFRPSHTHCKVIGSFLSSGQPASGLSHRQQTWMLAVMRRSQCCTGLFCTPPMPQHVHHWKLPSGPPCDGE